MTSVEVYTLYHQPPELIVIGESKQVCVVYNTCLCLVFVYHHALWIVYCWPGLYFCGRNVKCYSDNKHHVQMSLWLSNYLNITWFHYRYVVDICHTHVCFHCVTLDCKCWILILSEKYITSVILLNMSLCYTYTDM